ncbi:MAG: dockerin type I repeat-containing protein [Muribaculaceae bacterium]|nr:dockerin type I repeat-containing protein [Muribaculaceae bacterium]
MIKRLFYLLIIPMLCSQFCYGDEITNGEYATLEDGTPAMIGQTTLDHLFIRGDYDDNGILMTYDNVVSFKSGDTQLVWFWLDDDQMYLNEKVQALTPTLIANNAEPYNEITYYSFQCNVYLPVGINIVEIENEDGDLVICERGDRLPNSAEYLYSEKENSTIVIDGATYHVYTMVITNKQFNGTHFSSRNARMYRENGALKKDDAPLFGIYLRNENQNVAEGKLDDMIIANIEFGFIEAFTNEPQWEPNEYRFIYGEGGNNETQRFQYYNRVALYGSEGIENGLIMGDVNGDGVVDISDATTLIGYLLNGNASGINMTVADVDNSGVVDISDATSLISFLLNGHF